VTACPASAGILTESIDISISAEGKKMTGSTLYHIDFTEEYWHWYWGYVRGTGASELEYPLDINWGYAGISINGRIPQSLDWTIGVEYGQNLSDPNDPMKDSDWYRIPGTDLDHLIIYTESDAKADATHLNVFGRLKFGSTPKFRIDGLIGYSYQKLAFEMFGINNGWYLDEEYRQVPIDGSEYDGVKVLTYEVKYQIPYLGIYMDIKPYPKFFIGVEIAVSPYAMAKDLDYHLLRYFYAEGDCTGAAFMGKGDLGYSLEGPWSGLRWLFSIGYDFTTISTTGREDQVWYADNPNTSYDETGLTIEDTSHKIKSTQKALTLKITCLF
jgi:outer membrane protease